MNGSSNSKRSVKAGLPPGTLVYLGGRSAGTTSLKVINYNKDNFNEYVPDSPQESHDNLKSGSVNWINITGMQDMKILQSYGDLFGIHPLVLEDIANVSQRPKMEEHDDYIFIVLKMLYHNQTAEGIVSEQVSFVLGKNYLLSFQEVEGDVFDSVRNRISSNAGRIRSEGSDYLAYALIDSIVDNYFAVIENLNDRIESLQQKVLNGSDSEMLENIHRLKREIIAMRKNLWPLRELLGALEKCESKLIDKSTKIYIRDVYEHTIHVIDALESLRDLLSGALEIYLSSMSNRMNEVMKVLTIIATIFIPLTFVAGIYGMNFKYMPELDYKYAYPVVWAVMFAISAGMLVFFKRKKWI